MRGAGPAIPERAGAHSLTADATLQLRGDGAWSECPRRATEGHKMKTNLRRRGGHRQLQPMRRPNNGANARQHYERYLARARDAQLSGDAIEMENCYQHAEHYFRIMRGAGDEFRD
jgi:hypothetical protein